MDESGKTEVSAHSLEECKKSGRHTIIGSEMLPLDQFRGDVQSACMSLMRDTSKLTVFRAAGDNRAMAGVVLEGVFFVLGIEARINTLYPHGRSR